MRHELRIPERALRRFVEDLTTDPEGSIETPAGLALHPDRVEWLLPPARAARENDDRPRVVVIEAGHASGREALLRTLARLSPDRPTALLALGIGPRAGQIAGLCYERRIIAPLGAVTVVGPAYPRISLQPEIAPSLATRFGGTGPVSRAPGRTTGPSGGEEAGPREVWSRTIGALGEEAHARATSLAIAIVGVGRLGSLVATSLARFGVGHLTLIDPDRVEPHNVGEMDAVTLTDVGERKVEAVAAFLRQQFPGAGVTTVPEPIEAFAAMLAIKQADVIVSCADDGAARLAAGLLATVYLKPLIDLGTGIFRVAPSSGRARGRSRSSAMRSRLMGADIRLVLPGECLLCLGGVVDLPEALSRLGRRDVLLPDRSRNGRDWQEQRAGSLHSLNQATVGQGRLLLEALLEGRLGASVWLRMEIDETGIPSLESRPPLPIRPYACPLCALAARGDQGVRAFVGR